MGPALRAKARGPAAPPAAQLSCRRGRAALLTDPASPRSKFRTAEFPDQVAPSAPPLQFPNARGALPGAALRPQPRVTGRPAAPVRRRFRRQRCHRGSGGRVARGTPRRPLRTGPQPSHPPSTGGKSSGPSSSLPAGRPCRRGERSAPLTAYALRRSPLPRPSSSAGESGAHRHFVRPGGRERGEGRRPGGGRATSCCPRPPRRGFTRPAEFTFSASSPAGASREFGPSSCRRGGRRCAHSNVLGGGGARGGAAAVASTYLRLSEGNPAEGPGASPRRPGTGPAGLRRLCFPPYPPPRFPSYGGGSCGVPRRGSHAVPNQCIRDGGGDLGVIREQHFRLMNGSSQLSALMKVSACS